MATQPAPPSIPPRPSRSKSPAQPAVPPRPSRLVARTHSTENALLSPCPSPDPEPTPKTISPSTELHAPVALPVPKLPPTTTPTTTSTTTSTSTASLSPVPQPQSRKGSDAGIPQIGRRVPMYPNAGDVQAPTPSATPSGGRKKHVYREEWEMDEGAYSSKRRETPYSMSSNDLNAVVAQTATPGLGPKDEDGVPDEELGYLANDHFTKAMSRSHSPVHGKRPSIDGEAIEEEQEVAPPQTDEDGNFIHFEDPSHGPGYFRSGNADRVTSRAQSPHNDPEPSEDHDAYSILAEDEVQKRQQYMQAAVYTPSYTPRHPRSRPQSSLGPHRDDVEGASLELTTRFKSGLESRDSMRTPFENLSPADENAKPLFPEDIDEVEKPINPVVKKIKRPGLEHRFPSNDFWEEAPNHAQLEATIETPPAGEEKPAVEDEFQAVIPEPKKPHEPITQYILGQPSQHYQPGDEREYERTQKAAARPSTDYRLDLKDLPDDERLNRLHKRSGSGDVTPETSTTKRGVHRRKFPSKDIWEDMSDHEEELEPSPPLQTDRATTGDISRVQQPEARPTTGAPLDVSTTTKPIPPARPSIPARPHREKKPHHPATIQEQTEPPAVPEPEKKPQPAPILEPSAHTPPAAPEKKPQPVSTPVPSAHTPPAAPEKKHTPPSIPDRPKPAIPARPGKLAPGFLRTLNEDKPEPKPKPPVPPRSGSKIAALKAGFLGDLESRLRLGPVVPAKKEEEKEEPAKEEPLVDLRKTRARGPRGRKLPTKEEKAPAVTVKADGGAKVDGGNSLVGVWTVFTLDENLDAVVIGEIKGALEPIPEKETVVVRKGGEDVEVGIVEEAVGDAKEAVIGDVDREGVVGVHIDTPEQKEAVEIPAEKEVGVPVEKEVEVPAKEVEVQAKKEVEIPEEKEAEIPEKKEAEIPEEKESNVPETEKAAAEVPEVPAAAADALSADQELVKHTSIPADEHPEDAVQPLSEEVERDGMVVEKKEEEKEEEEDVVSAKAV